MSPAIPASGAGRASPEHILGRRPGRQRHRPAPPAFRRAVQLSHAGVSVRPIPRTTGAAGARHRPPIRRHRVAWRTGLSRSPPGSTRVPRAGRGAGDAAARGISRGGAGPWRSRRRRRGAQGSGRRAGSRPATPAARGASSPVVTRGPCRRSAARARVATEPVRPGRMPRRPRRRRRRYSAAWRTRSDNSASSACLASAGIAAPWRR